MKKRCQHEKFYVGSLNKITTLYDDYNEEATRWCTNCGALFNQKLKKWIFPKVVKDDKANRTNETDTWCLYCVNAPFNSDKCNKEIYKQERTTKIPPPHYKSKLRKT